MDQKGRLVHKRSLGRLPIGNHNFNLDAKSWVSGMYFVQLEVSDVKMTQKITLLK
jgi:hypothetical protein